MSVDSRANLDRYARQVRFAPLGEAGQRRLLGSRVTLIGCGALGAVLADTLVRAGVGYLRLIDRDFVELDNLPRQALFDEQDVAENQPKAEAAARKLRRINSTVTVEPIIADVHRGNVEEYCRDADLLLDGTDNFETRYLINDVAVSRGVPWIYGACVAAEGRVLPILPGETPCLRCVFPDAPPPGSVATCETAGVLGPIVHVVAGMQAAEALKLLAGRHEALNRRLTVIDLWAGRMRGINVDNARTPKCPCCGRREFAYLIGGRGSESVTLCGRNAVQVTPPTSGELDLPALADRLGPDASPRLNRFLLRFVAGEHEVTLFRDGRAIIKGTTDAGTARRAYARYVGA